MEVMAIAMTAWNIQAADEAAGRSGIFAHLFFEGVETNILQSL